MLKLQLTYLIYNGWIYILLYNRWIDLIIQPYKCLVIQDLISQRSLHGNQGDTNTPTPQIHTMCFVN